MLEIEHPLTGEKVQIANKDFSKEMNWYEAIEACEKLGSGWRLPSIEELYVMYEVLYREEKGNLTDRRYWSSSEWDADDALFIYFESGHELYNSKTTTKNQVRAVRAF